MTSTATAKYSIAAAESFELGAIEPFRVDGDDLFSKWTDPDTGTWCVVNHDRQGDWVHAVPEYEAREAGWIC